MNYLALEDLIIARLKARLPELSGAIDGMYDLDGVSANAQQAPRIDVVPFGEQVLPGDKQRSHNGLVQIVQQRWMVVAVVRNGRDMRTGVAARREAGDLLWRINASLQGWNPGPDFGPLHKINAPPPQYEKGFGYFPLAYASNIVRKGESQP
jgi:hypothetical protein